MEIENDRFMDLVPQQQTLEDGIPEVLDSLMANQDRITARENRFLPDMLAE
jgi:hypothetical protein